MSRFDRLPVRTPLYRDRASRSLFELRASDVAALGAMIPRTDRSGTAMTLTRATDGRFIDGNGVFVTARHSAVRTEMVDLDGDGVRETPSILLEHAATNRILQSTSITTTPWSAANTPTRVAAAVVLGDVSLDLLGDTSGSLVASYSQTVTFVGNAVKSFAVVVKKGPSAPASGSRFLFRDTTASADRLNAVLTWIGTVPSVAVTAGTYLGAIALANGGYELQFATASITAANTNVFTVSPAQVAAEQGNLYVGGFHADDNPVPTSIIDTAASAVTRNQDLAQASILWLPQVCTVYLKAVFTPTAQGREDHLIRIGTDDLDNTAKAGFGLLHDSTTNLIARVLGGGSSADAAVNTATAFAGAGATAAHEVLMNINAAGFSIALDGGVAVTGTFTLPTAFNSQTLQIVGDNNLRLLELKIAAGVQTLTQMRTP